MATALQAEQPGLRALTPAPFVVTSRTQETADTWTLSLEAAAGAGRPSRPASS